MEALVKREAEEEPIMASTHHEFPVKDEEVEDEEVEEDLLLVKQEELHIIEVDFHPDGVADEDDGGGAHRTGAAWARRRRRRGGVAEIEVVLEDDGDDDDDDGDGPEVAPVPLAPPVAFPVGTLVVLLVLALRLLLLLLVIEERRGRRAERWRRYREEEGAVAQGWREILRRRREQRKRILRQLFRRRRRASVWALPRSAPSWWEPGGPSPCPSPSSPAPLSDTGFRLQFGVSRAAFEAACARLRPALERRDTAFRPCVPVRRRVAVAMWKLAGGAGYEEAARMFGVSVTTAWRCVREFLAAAGGGGRGDGEEEGGEGYGVMPRS